MTAKAILGVIPGLQATALVTENLKLVNNKSFLKGKSKISPKKITKVGVTNLIGISLLKPTAKMINSL